MSRFFQCEGDKPTGRKVCLATTSYGNPDAGYTFSIASSREALHKAGIQTAYYLLQGNCHVDDARNRVVQAFLASDCTDLAFLDADVTWGAETLVKLCQYDRQIVGGVYPYRRENSNELPARLIDGAPIEDDGLIEVEGLPTGFMRIHRSVFERLMEGAKSFQTADGPQYIFFERTLINGTRWGGDLHFCNSWRAVGGKLYADPEMALGHVGETTTKSSMAAILRKRNRLTLAHVVQKIRNGTHTLQDLAEAFDYMGNKWGAKVDVLAIAIGLAKQADGPIIEAGSGLTTILMAAATDQTVYCLEHDPVYAAKLRQLCAEANVRNVGLCHVPLRSEWYDIDGFKGLPSRFALGLNDGPPRADGDRMKFFGRLACDVVVCDDADDPAYRGQLVTKADELGLSFDHPTPRAAILRAPKLEEAA